MYLPRDFAEHDLAALDALLERDAFVTLISHHDGAPFATPLPVLYRRDGDTIVLRGHWSRANPQWRHVAGQTVLMVVHGPHAYVSPTWYPDPASRAPTWNYATAHLYGQVTLIEDATALSALVSELAAHYETRNGSDWRLDNASDATRGNVRGIVGFELTVTRAEIKYKLNQNHPPENRRAVAAAFERLGGDDRRTLAAWMRARQPEDTRDET